MSLETELLWMGAVLLLLLGTVAGLCARCSRPGAKKPKKIYEQRSLQESRQSFGVARTYSLVRQAWPGRLVDTTPATVQTRKNKLVHFSPSVEDPASSRYQNFRKASWHESDAAYIDPIAEDYYNWGQFQKPPEDDDDCGSYQNVLICKPGHAETGSPVPDDEKSEDYQNSLSIQQWRDSRRTIVTPRGRAECPAEFALMEAALSRTGSADEDGSEPDYVNKDVAGDT